MGFRAKGLGLRVQGLGWIAGPSCCSMFGLFVTGRLGIRVASGRYGLVLRSHESRGAKLLYDSRKCSVGL